MKQLQNIHPKEYVKSAFTANGYDAVKQVEIITHCIKRFQTPTSEQLQAYSTDILMAVRNNDLSTAKTLYREGKFNCNACNRFGESILHIACRRGHLEMVQFFVEEVKMKVHEIRDDYHRTPLHDAFWTSKASPTVIDYLLRQPFVIELLLLEDKRGYTPLDYARSEDRSKWLHFFWERKQVLVPTDNTHSNNISNNNDNSNNNIRNNILLESEIGNDIDVDYYDSDDFTTSTTCSSNNSDDNNELIMTKSASEDVRTPSTKRQKLLIIG